MSEGDDSGKRAGSRIGIWLVWVGAGGLVFAAVVGGFGRWWWVADLFSHFVMYYLATSIGTAVMALVLRRWIALGVALGLCVWCGALVWPLYAPPQNVAVAGPGTHGPVLRLAQVNLLHKNRDRDHALAFFRGCPADLIVIQEIDPWWERVLLEADLPYRFVVSEPVDHSFGIALLVRDPVPAEAGWSLQTARLLGEAEGFARPSIEAELVMDGQRVTLLSIHPPPPTSRDLTAERDAILCRAKVWVGDQIDPHIILGDLNTTPWSYAFKILTGDGSLVSTQNGWGNQGTWPTRLPLPWLLPIDHCLVSRGWVCVDRRIGPETGSDHLPLMVDLSLSR